MEQSYLPSHSFICSGATVIASGACSFVTINQTIELDQLKIEKLWDALNAVDHTTMPYNRVCCALIFYSSYFKLKALESKEYHPITLEIYNEIIKEWTQLSSGNTSKCFEYCICGHEVAYPFFIKNVVNGNVLKMSGDCIKRLCHPIMSEVVDICRKQIKYSGPYKMCAICYIHKVPSLSSSSSQICSTCTAANLSQIKPSFLIAMQYRPCKICGNSSISGDSPDYKDMCLNCYKVKQLEVTVQNVSSVPNDLGAEPTFKQCEKCHQNNIPIADSWKKICVRCYTLSIAIGKVACGKCGLMKVAADKAHIFKNCYTCNQK